MQRHKKADSQLGVGFFIAKCFVARCLLLLATSGNLPLVASNSRQQTTNSRHLILVIARYKAIFLITH